MPNGFLQRFTRLNALQRTWVVATVLWLVTVGYFGVREFPTEAKIRDREFNNQILDSRTLKKALDNELQRCISNNPRTDPPYHIDRINCEVAAHKRHGEQIKDARESSERWLYLALQELEYSQLLTALTILSLAILPPVLIYAAVWWIVGGIRRPQSP